MFLLHVGKKKIDDKLMDAMNKWGEEVYKNAYDYYSKMAKDESENTFTIFDDWWHGKCVSTEEYMSKFSKEENERAGNIILTAISSGFG